MKFRKIIEWGLFVVVLVILGFQFKGCFFKDEGFKISSPSEN